MATTTVADPTIPATTNPPGGGMLNSTPVLTNANSTSNLPPPGGTPPADTVANAPAKTYDAALGTAGTASSTHYDATPYTVAPEGLVEHRIKGLVAQDSPLMQQARELANVQSNSRGLLNSSIGVAAGQSAVIGAAAPIATADAGSINQAMTNTANAQNAAAQFNAGADNSTSH